MEKKLEFLNPIFKEGINTTCRRGTKWSGATGKVELPDGRTAEILYTQVFKFSDLGDDEISNEHDPSCTNWPGLHNAMKAAYKGFDAFEIVTLVHFQIDPHGY